MLFAHVVVCVLLVAVRNTSASVIPAPSDAVRSLVVVGSQREPRACIGVWTGGAFAIAPAHCLAQMRGAPAEFVDFGFQPTSAPRDPVDGRAELVGAFKHDKRIAIARIVYHPRFTNASTQLSRNTTAGVDSTLTEFDWALIKLQEPQASDSYTNIWLSGLMTSEARRRSSGAVGMFRIDRASLDVRYVNDTLLLDNARCALDPSAATANEFLCAVPRYPEARRNADNRNRSADWSVLVLRPRNIGESDLLLGFETSNADVASFTSFTTVGGTAKYFLIDANGGNVVFDDQEIVGGVDVQIAPELAFIAGVRATRTGRNVCGGSLVAPTFVLTAAHCLDSVGASPWVSIGSERGEGDAIGEQIKVTRVLRHPRYDKAAMRYDLALLELKYPSIQTPVALASGSTRHVRAAKVLGFGTASAQESAALSLVLQSAAVDVIASSQQCSLEVQLEVDDSMLCAVGKGSADACAGDSGGPLIVHPSSGSGAPTLVGVVSYGRGCGFGLPGVYADVARGLAFIRSVIRGGAEGTALPTQAPVRPSATPVVPVDRLPSTLSPLASATPSTTTSVRSATTTPEWSSLSPQSSSQQLGDLPVSPTNHHFEVSSTTPSRVRDALARFLTGDLSNIVDTQRTSKRFDNRAIVFVSTTALDGLEAILTKYSDKALSQRTRRFQAADTATPSSLKTQHWVC